jgi:hypothetical protein
VLRWTQKIIDDDSGRRMNRCRSAACGSTSTGGSLMMETSWEARNEHATVPPSSGNWIRSFDGVGESMRRRGAQLASSASVTMAAPAS